MKDPILKGLSANGADEAVHVPSLIESVHCILNKAALKYNEMKIAYPNDFFIALCTTVGDITFETGTAKYKFKQISAIIQTVPAV